MPQSPPCPSSWGKLSTTLVANSVVAHNAFRFFQFLVAFLGLFSVFRGIKVCFYRTEDEKVDYHEVQLPTHEDVERGSSIPAAV